MTTTTAGRRAWFGVLAGPLAWTVDELTAIALAYDGCARDLTVSGGAWIMIMTLVGIVALVVTATSMIGAWRAIAGEPIDSGLGDVADDRARFMARFGLVVGALSLFAILLRTATVLFLGHAPC